LTIMIRPNISRKANTAGSLLCLISIRPFSRIVKNRIYREFFLKVLEPRLPCLDNSFTNLHEVWDILVLYVCSQEQKEIAKLSALDDIDRLRSK
jgi:hypothetical protein